MKNINTTQRKKLLQIFLRVMAISAISILIIGGIAVYSVSAIFNKIAIKEELDPNLPTYDRNEDMQQQDVNLNIAVFGVDKDETRTDVIFVVHFNSETGATKVVAVPRDTKVTWSDYQKEKARELGKSVHDESKITDMSSYGGIDNLRYFTINSLENTLGIKIDHYVVVNIDAFRKIVDAIGGVEVEVPRRMEYSDSSQGLYIDLEPGVQVLNGEQAEGLVRWRHNDDYSEQYGEGDVGRIETQQIFLEAFAKKVLSPSTIKSLPKIANIVYSDLRTDIGLKEISSYLGYINKVKLDQLSFYTLPGEAAYENRRWYYLLDYDQIDSFVMEHFNDIKPTSETPEPQNE